MKRGFYHPILTGLLAATAFVHAPRIQAQGSTAVMAHADTTPPGLLTIADLPRVIDRIVQEKDLIALENYLAAHPELKAFIYKSTSAHPLATKGPINVFDAIMLKRDPQDIGKAIGTLTTVFHPDYITYKVEMKGPLALLKKIRDKYPAAPKVKTKPYEFDNEKVRLPVADYCMDEATTNLSADLKCTAEILQEFVTPLDITPPDNTGVKRPSHAEKAKKPPAKSRSKT